MFGKKEDKKEPHVQPQDHVAAEAPDQNPAQPQTPESEIETLKQQLGETKDKYIRLFAEFDNVRKRHERERMELIKYAHEEVIIEMLGFYEDFERAVEAARKDPSGQAQLLKGVEMTLKRMQELMKKYDVKAIEALGKPFDHNLHEAMMVAETNEQPDNTVLEVFQKGYLLGDRVVRTAKVKVARKSAADVEKERENKD